MAYVQISTCWCFCAINQTHTSSVVHAHHKMGSRAIWYQNWFRIWHIWCWSIYPRIVLTIHVDLWPLCDWLCGVCWCVPHTAMRNWTSMWHILNITCHSFDCLSYIMIILNAKMEIKIAKWHPQTGIIVRLLSGILKQASLFDSLVAWGYWQKQITKQTSSDWRLESFCTLRPPIRKIHSSRHNISHPMRESFLLGMALSYNTLP